MTCKIFRDRVRSVLEQRVLETTLEVLRGEACFVATACALGPLFPVRAVSQQADGCRSHIVRNIWIGPLKLDSPGPASHRRPAWTTSLL